MLQSISVSNFDGSSVQCGCRSTCIERKISKNRQLDLFDSGPHLLSRDKFDLHRQIPNPQKHLPARQFLLGWSTALAPRKPGEMLNIC
jgi:hypothetical protein